MTQQSLFQILNQEKGCVRKKTFTLIHINFVATFFTVAPNCNSIDVHQNMSSSAMCGV